MTHDYDYHNFIAFLPSIDAERREQKSAPEYEEDDLPEADVQYLWNWSKKCFNPSLLTLQWFAGQHTLIKFHLGRLGLQQSLV